MLMRAAFLAAPGRFEIREIPIPVPGRDEALVRLTRAGLCGGDLQQYRKATTALPFVPGHEGCGIVERAPGQEHWEGQRVTFDPQVYWCGECEWCLRGATELCAQRAYLGAQRHGTFAQYVVVPANRLFTLPAQIDWDAAANVHALAGPLFASQRFTHRIGETVAVLGPGAAGLLFVQVARCCHGAGQVVLAGRSAHRLELGRALGADHVIDTRERSLQDAIMECTKGRGVDVVIETTGSPQIRAEVAGLCAPQARVLSYAVGDIGFDSLKSISVHGSTGATGCMQPALDLIGSQRVQVDALVSHRFALDDIQQAFDLAISDAKGGFVKAVFVLSE